MLYFHNSFSWIVWLCVPQPPPGPPPSSTQTFVLFVPRSVLWRSEGGQREDQKNGLMEGLAPPLFSEQTFSNFTFSHNSLQNPTLELRTLAKRRKTMFDANSNKWSHFTTWPPPGQTCRLQQLSLLYVKSLSKKTFIWSLEKRFKFKYSMVYPIKIILIINHCLS